MRIHVRSLFVAMLATVILTAGTCGAPDPPNFELRHDFSLTPALPDSGSTRPTSCIDEPDGGGYMCRTVWGYEQTGGNGYYIISGADALETANSSTYGANVIARNGKTYEGCESRGGTWWCDYQTTSHVARQHTTGTGTYFLDVFRNWVSYAADQAACAVGLSAALIGRNKWVAALILGCRQGPLHS